MTVRQLLEMWEDHYYTMVVISEDVYNPEYHGLEEQTVAIWNPEEHDDWYCGQLDYFSDRDVNELKPYFKAEVKSFITRDDIKNIGRSIIYITIK